MTIFLLHTVIRIYRHQKQRETSTKTFFSSRIAQFLTHACWVAEMRNGKNENIKYFITPNGNRTQHLCVYSRTLVLLLHDALYVTKFHCNLNIIVYILTWSFSPPFVSSSTYAVPTRAIGTSVSPSSSKAISPISSMTGRAMTSLFSIGSLPLLISLFFLCFPSVY